MEPALIPNGSVEKTDLKSLISRTPSFSADSRLEQVLSLMSDRDYEYVAVVNNGKVVGICSRGRLGGMLGTRYGFAVKGKAKLGDHMESNPLIVRISQPLVEILQLALTRPQKVFNYDVIVIDDEEQYLGLFKVSDLARLQNQLVDEKIRHLEAQKEDLESFNHRLSAMTDALKKTNRELEVARDQGLQAAQAKAEFLAVMSHEIRTPLNGVLGMLTLLSDSSLNDEQSELAHAAAYSAEALLSILNDILDFSRLDSGNIELENRKFDIRELAESVVSLMAESAHESHVEILCDVSLDTPRFGFGDSGRLRQVLVNLVGNAVKFTRKGEVCLSIRSISSDANLLRIEILDTGIGISEEARKRLFQPFVQADSSTTRNYGGTGLGLAICQRLVQAMGSEIKVDSVEGRGSTFWFDLSLNVYDDEILRYHPRRRESDAEAFIALSNSRESNILGRELEVRGIPITHFGATSDFAKAIGQDRAGKRIFIAEEETWRHQVLDTNASRLKVVIRESHSCPEDNYDEFTTFIRRPLRPSQLDRTLDQLLKVSDVKRVGADSSAKQRNLAVSNEVDKPKILLVEDHEINRRLAIKLLEKLGYECDVSEDGLLALERCQKAAYPLILLDCQMPRMDGYEFTKELRALERADSSRPVAHIIALTANAMAGDRELCMAAGMNDYLSKPLKPADLKTAIEVVLSSDRQVGNA